jgi:L-ascorbate metabolism protein UlaG (beta-lactamase superfamily)
LKIGDFTLTKKNELSKVLNEFYNCSLDDSEVAFIYFGWAGILLKAKNKILALDIGKKCLDYKQIRMVNKLDLHLYSHTHWDHFDPAVTLELFQKTEAPIIVEPQIYDEFKDMYKEKFSQIQEKLYRADPNKTLNINGFSIDSIIGVHPRPITLFRISWNGFSIFHGADSGYVSLSNFPSKLAFIPTGTPSPSCSPENGLKMALDISPEVVVAIHGTVKQMLKFKTLISDKLPDTSTIIPELKELVVISI